MADSLVLNAGCGGANLAVDNICETCTIRAYQVVKHAFGPLDTATLVTACVGFPVDLKASVTLTVTGDCAGSLTVDNAGLTELAAAITCNQVQVDIAAVSGATFPVTDNCAALTIDHTTLDNAHSADFDTGAGTDTTPAFGIAVPASGGAVVVPGDATNGLTVNLGCNNDVTICGTVTVTGDCAGSLTVDNAGLTELAAAINCSQVDVDIKASDLDLMLGTDFSSVLGTASLVDGSNHLQVDIAADSVGIGGGTQYTEDAAAAADPVGNAVILVRDDVPGALVSADGDNVAQRGTNFGAAFVQVVDSCGNFVDTFGGSGGTAMIDDAAFTVATTQGTPAFAMFDDACPDSVDEGDAGIVRMSANRNMYVTLRDAAGNERGLNVDACGQIAATVSGTVTVTGDCAGSLTVDGTVAVSSITTSVTPGTAAANLGKAEDAAHTTGDVGVMALAVRTGSPVNRSGTDGDYEPLQVSAGRLWTSSTVTSVVPGTGATNLGKAEDAGHTSGDTGVMALSVRSSTATALAGTNLDYQPLITNASGRLYVTSAVDTALPTGTNTIGDVGLIPRTSGGLCIFRSIDLDESEEAVKASAGQMFSIMAFNTTAAPLYLKLYNQTVACTTVGTTTPVLTAVIPGNADSDGAGFVWNCPVGMTFSTAITAAVTTGVADADTGAPGANAAVVNIGYK